MKIDVRGDFEGSGMLRVRPTSDGFCQAHLHWRTDVVHPYVTHFKRALHPVFVWNHKWAMRTARRLMQAEVYRRRFSSAQFGAARATFPHNSRLVRDWVRRRAERRRSDLPTFE